MAIGETLGLLAGLLTTFGVVPQIIRVFRTKSARDISLTFNLMSIIGGVLWLTYGIMDRLFPLILWNILGISFNVMLFFGIMKYSKVKKAN